jgi:hypothetical protein
MSGTGIEMRVDGRTGGNSCAFSDRIVDDGLVLSRDASEMTEQFIHE